MTDSFDKDFGDAVRMICYCEDSAALGVAKRHIKDILTETAALIAVAAVYMAY